MHESHMTGHLNCKGGPASALVHNATFATLQSLGSGLPLQTGVVVLVVVVEAVTVVAVTDVTVAVLEVKDVVVVVAVFVPVVVDMDVVVAEVVEVVVAEVVEVVVVEIVTVVRDVIVLLVLVAVIVVCGGGTNMQIQSKVWANGRHKEGSKRQQDVVVQQGNCVIILRGLGFYLATIKHNGSGAG